MLRLWPDGDPAALKPGGGGDSPKTLTQDEVNALVGKVRQEERQKVQGQYADYDDLKLQAGELQKIREAQMTTEQKLRKRADDLEKQTAQQATRIAETAISYEVRLRAASKGIIDPDAALALINRKGITYSEEGGVQGVDEALAQLAESKPYLLGQPKAPPNLNGKEGTPAPLTRLSADQRDAARRMGLSEDEYAKGIIPAAP